MCGHGQDAMTTNRQPAAVLLLCLMYAQCVGSCIGTRGGFHRRSSSTTDNSGWKKTHFNCTSHTLVNVACFGPKSLKSFATLACLPTRNAMIKIWKIARQTLCSSQQTPCEFSGVPHFTLHRRLAKRSQLSVCQLRWEVHSFYHIETQRPSTSLN